MSTSFPSRAVSFPVPVITALASALLATASAAQTPVSQQLPLPTESMSGSILFASLIGPPDGYAILVSLHAEFVPGGTFTPDDLQIVLSAPTQPNFDHWVVQGGADLGWATGSGLQVGDASTVILNGEIQGSFGGPSVWTLVIEPVPGSGHNGVTGQFTSGAHFQVDYLPVGQGPGVGYCFGSSCPCGNDDPNAGCANSTGSGALLSASGFASVASDDLDFVVSGMPANQIGRVYTGQNQALVPFGNGRRCVGGGSTGLIRFPVGTAGAVGTMSLNGVISTAQGISPGSLAAGSTWNFQTWYRDPTGPCGNGFNFSNALRIVIIP